MLKSLHHLTWLSLLSLFYKNSWIFAVFNRPFWPFQLFNATPKVEREPFIENYIVGYDRPACPGRIRLQCFDLEQRSQKIFPFLNFRNICHSSCLSASRESQKEHHLLINTTTMSPFQFSFFRTWGLIYSFFATS